MGEGIPDVGIVPSKSFLSATYPWFEPANVPGNSEALATVLAETKVQQKVADLGLHYVVVVGGGTLATGKGWGGAVGGGGSPYGAVIGGVNTEKKTRLTATILDMQASKKVAHVEVFASGEAHVGLIVLIPYIVISPTEGAACKALAQRVVGILKKPPPPS